MPVTVGQAVPEGAFDQPPAGSRITVACRSDSVV